MLYLNRIKDYPFYNCNAAVINVERTSIGDTNIGLTSDHEVLLINNTWVKISEVNEGDSILCTDSDMKVSFFDTVSKKTSKRYSGKLLRAVSEDYDLLTTSEYILPYKTNVCETPKYDSISTFLSDKPIHGQFPQGIEFIGYDRTDEDHGIIKDTICRSLTNEQRFSLLTDLLGYYRKDKNGKKLILGQVGGNPYYTYRLDVKGNYTKAEQIYELTEALGWDSTHKIIKPMKGTLNTIRITIKVPVSAELIDNFVDELEIYHYNHEWYMELINWLFLLVGNRRGSSYYDGLTYGRLARINEKIIDKLFTWCLLAGYKSFKVKYFEEKLKKFSYRLNINLKKTCISGVFVNDLEVVDITVWNLQVKYNHFVVRHNGKIGLATGLKFQVKSKIW